MSMITADLTPTQREAMERSRRFKASIAQKAADLQVAKLRKALGEQGCEIEPPFNDLTPEAMPAEPDPLEETTAPVLIRIADIQAAVCKFFSIPRNELLGDSRIRSVVFARHIAIYLADALSRHSGQEIGRRFARDHSSIIHAIRRIGRLMHEDEKIAHEVATLAEIVTGSTDDVMGPHSDRSPRKSKKVTYWANVYRPAIGSCGHVYASKEVADQMAARDRLVCVAFKVEMPTSEGDDVSDNQQR